jgi:hypothetical protein
MGFLDSVFAGALINVMLLVDKLSAWDFWIVLHDSSCIIWQKVVPWYKPWYTKTKIYFFEIQWRIFPHIQMCVV